jgi:hypothetical protein
MTQKTLIWKTWRCWNGKVSAFTSLTTLTILKLIAYAATGPPEEPPLTSDDGNAAREPVDPITGAMDVDSENISAKSLEPSLTDNCGVSSGTSPSGPLGEPSHSTAQAPTEQSGLPSTESVRQSFATTHIGPQNEASLNPPPTPPQAPSTQSCDTSRPPSPTTHSGPLREPSHHSGGAVTPSLPDVVSSNDPRPTTSEASNRIALGEPPQSAALSTSGPQGDPSVNDAVAPHANSPVSAIDSECRTFMVSL